MFRWLSAGVVIVAVMAGCAVEPPAEYFLVLANGTDGPLDVVVEIERRANGSVVHAFRGVLAASDNPVVETVRSPSGCYEVRAAAGDLTEVDRLRLDDTANEYRISFDIDRIRVITDQYRDPPVDRCG